VLAALPLPLCAEELSGGPDAASLHVWDMPSLAASASVPGRQRIRLFRFAPGFLSDPVGLQDQDDSPPGTTPSTPAVTDISDGGPDWVQLALGADNPYFDFRLPGDPGGIGFNRLVTQVQLINTTKTSCTLDLQAVTPAGIQWFGVQDGPTVVVPSLGIFQAINEDTALQGFIGKNMPLQGSLPAMPVRRSVRCGMALQRSVLPDGPEALRNLYFFMGALGELQRPEVGVPGSAATMNWQVMPGLHWKLTESWWMSGGLMLPARATLPEGPLPWQVTCSLQF